MTEKRNRWLMCYFIGIFLGCCMILTSCGKKEEILFIPSEDSVRIDHEEASDSEKESEMPETIWIDVDGAVKNPGVYEMMNGSRVFQAVEAAGGILDSASCRSVNLASVLTDEQHIYIPFEEEADDTWNPNEMNSIQTNGKVNINQADMEQLKTLTGIGESRAKDILNYRAEHGSFSSIEEIMNVQGIKEGTFAKIKDEIVVG